MPNNVRQNLKREAERANGNLDMAMRHGLALQEAFKTQHPEIAEQIQVFLDGCIILQEMMDRLRISI